MFSAGRPTSSVVMTTAPGSTARVNVARARSLSGRWKPPRLCRLACARPAAAHEVERAERPLDDQHREHAEHAREVASVRPRPAAEEEESREYVWDRDDEEHAPLDERDEDAPDRDGQHQVAVCAPQEPHVA